MTGMRTRYSRVFANCKVQESFRSGNFKISYKESLPGYECITAILPYAIKEHEHSSSNEEVILNQMLRSVGNMIECVFGRLKARVRILLCSMDISIEKLPNIIYACFLFYNYCEEAKGKVNVNFVETFVQK